MEEWKEYRLGDVISIKSGFAYKGDMIGRGEGVLLGMGCVSFKEKFLITGARAYGGDCADRYCAKVGDIVLATRQQSDNLPILGMPAIIPNDLSNKRIIIGANLYRVENSSDFSNDYIYWLLKTPLYVNHIRSCQSGTTVRMITKANIEDFRFIAPEKEEREQIVSILKSLDDKIELNRRINANLEAQAQALFKSWFVDFEPFRDGEFVESELGMIPKGWKVYELQELVTIKRGGSPRPIQDYLSEIGYSWLKISDATSTDSPFIFAIKEKIKECGLSKTIHLEKGSLVLSNSATPGIPKIMGVDTCIHDGWLYFPQSQLSKLFLYLLFKNKRDYLLSQGNGSVFTNLKTDIVKALNVALPPMNTMELFNQSIEALFNEIEVITMESSRLATLRDTLLPRLMSGEIKVGDVTL